MAYGIVHHFQDGEKEHYDAAVEQVHPSDGLPEGQTHHFAGKTADGWIVVAIHEDEESWNRFRDETLNPGLQGVEGGFPNPPEEIGFDVLVEQHA